MKIRKVVLKNIRSHVDSTIEFRDGFNCIVGGVGGGKSSVIMAIHFALFGERLGKSYEYLLREGEPKGRVEVEFEHKGKLYKIARALKREGRRISQDAGSLALYENGRLIASGKSKAVNEQVSTILGVDENLFKNVIWVQQERLKDLLNLEPSKRQGTLDKLFGISDFLDAWQALRAYESRYEGERDAYLRDPDIINLDKLRAEYSSLSEELVNAQLAIEESRSHVKHAEEAYKKAEARYQELEAMKAELDELKRRASSLEGKTESMKDERLRIRGEIDKRKEKVKELQSRLYAMEDKLREVEKKLKELQLAPYESLADLKETMSRLESSELSALTSHNELKSELERVENLLNKMREERVCPFCKREIDDGLRAKLLAHLQEERQRKRVDASKLLANLEEIKRKRLALSGLIEDLTLITSQRDDLERRLNQEIKEMEASSSRLAELDRALSELGDQLSKIHEREASLDVTGLQEALRVRDESYKAYVNAKAQVEFKEKELAQKSAKLEDLKSKIDSAEEKFERKESVERVLSAIGEIRGVYKAVGPKLREDAVLALSHYVQQILDEMTEGGDRQYVIEVDETYTPRLKETGYWRDPSSLSGGERTLLALAYKIGTGQLIMGLRGMALDFLVLDEPTESLGPEDKSIERVAEAISRLKSIEFVITITHAEEFSKYADHVIRMVNEGSRSVVSYGG